VVKEAEWEGEKVHGKLMHKYRSVLSSTHTHTHTIGRHLLRICDSYLWRDQMSVDCGEEEEEREESNRVGGRERFGKQRI